MAPATIVIFGASGDLTQRKLVPALHSLACENLLAPGTAVIGVARSPLSDAEFRDELYGGVVDYSRLKPGICELWSSFEHRLTYQTGDYDDPDTYRCLAETLGGPATATACSIWQPPPRLYPQIIEQLGRAGLQRCPEGWNRIIIEKPFGRDPPAQGHSTGQPTRPLTRARSTASTTTWAKNGAEHPHLSFCQHDL